MIRPCRDRLVLWSFCRLQIDFGRPMCDTSLDARRLRKQVPGSRRVSHRIRRPAWWRPTGRWLASTNCRIEFRIYAVFCGNTWAIAQWPLRLSSIYVSRIRPAIVYCVQLNWMLMYDVMYIVMSCQVASCQWHERPKRTHDVHSSWAAVSILELIWTFAIFGLFISAVFIQKQSTYSAMYWSSGISLPGSVSNPRPTSTVDVR